MPNNKKKKLGEVGAGLKDFRESFVNLFSPEVGKGDEGEDLIKPKDIGDDLSDGLGAGNGDDKKGTPYDSLINQLSGAVGKAGETSLVEEKERLEEEKGVKKKQEIVGTFEEEIVKTQTLLDELEEDISERTKEFLVSDPQRRRILASERAPITKEFETLTRGLGVAEKGLKRTQADILTELGLIEKEKELPFDLLEREINIRTKIKELVDKDIPEAISTVFDDEGNLTIVTQDPDTGEFKTSTIPGIGEKASQYESITSQVDDEGNLTIIGITKGGEAKTLGTFKGVATTKTTDDSDTKIESDLIASRGTDGFVDPNTYMDLRTTAKTGPTEFDKRFSHLLSPQERVNLGIEKEGDITVKESMEKLGDIVTQYKDAGYKKKDFEKAYKAENDLDKIPDPIQDIIDNIFK